MIDDVRLFIYYDMFIFIGNRGLFKVKKYNKRKGCGIIVFGK